MKSYVACVKHVKQGSWFIKAENEEEARKIVENLIENNFSYDFESFTDEIVSVHEDSKVWDSVRCQML